MTDSHKLTSAKDAIFEDFDFIEMYDNRRPLAAASSEDARIIAGFEEICEFVDVNKTEPTDYDDFILAARLEAIRCDKRLRTLLAPYDRNALLGEELETSLPTTMDEVVNLDDPIFGQQSDNNMFNLKNVTDRSDYTYADDAAARIRCLEFDAYRPLFDQLATGLNTGRFSTKRELDNVERRKGVKSTVLGLTDLTSGTAFILNGITAYIAARKEGVERTVNRVRDAELHIVFDNGTEARDYLARSFARVLFDDPNGRQIVHASSGLPVNVDPTHHDLPMFGGPLELGPEDLQTGTLYVVESLSTDPQIVELRNRLYKIGFTAQTLEQRLVDAEADPTFLFAPVKFVAQYTIANVRPAAIERLIHEFFTSARLNIIVHLGRPVSPREWFVVPLPQIKAVVPMILDRSITQFCYDRSSGRIIRR